MIIFRKMNTFNTILYKVLSPKNVGMIVRSHVAFSGDKIVFVGYKAPWDFKKGSQAFSRKLEAYCDFLHFRQEADFFEWSEAKKLTNIAIEIDEEANRLPEYSFSGDCNLIVGSEKTGLSKAFMQRCDSILTIPQFGPVECLNVAVSSSIAMYEFRRLETTKLQIAESRY